MNAGKSLKVALAKRGMSQVEFARLVKMTQPSVSSLANSQNWTGGSLKKVSEALGMKASEFLALGED